MWKWDVQVLLPDGETWYTICTADSVEALGEIVRFLTKTWGDEQKNLMIFARAK